MTGADTVLGDRLFAKPRNVAIFFALAFVIFALPDFSQTALAEIFAPATGWMSPFGVRFTIALLLALALTLNVLLTVILPFRWQVVVIWAELLILFLTFFYLFDLSFPFILSKLPFLITQGVMTTLFVSAISICLASVIAIIGAVAKLSSNGLAVGIASFYTSFFRGLPLLVQVYLIYIGLPQLGIVIDAIPAGIIALSLNYGAYMTEIFRAGIQSVPHGQWEASRAIGFGFGTTMRRIILPQSIPLIVPPTGNQFIQMLKDSSLVSVLGVWELMFLARTLGQRDFRHLEMLITVALIYWVLSIVLEMAQSRIERHYSRYSKR